MNRRWFMGVLSAAAGALAALPLAKCSAAHEDLQENSGDLSEFSEILFWDVDGQEIGSGNVRWLEDRGLWELSVGTFDLRKSSETVYPVIFYIQEGPHKKLVFFSSVVLWQETVEDFWLVEGGTIIPSGHPKIAEIGDALRKAQISLGREHLIDISRLAPR